MFLPGVLDVFIYSHFKNKWNGISCVGVRKKTLELAILIWEGRASTNDCSLQAVQYWPAAFPAPGGPSQCKAWCLPMLVQSNNWLSMMSSAIRHIGTHLWSGQGQNKKLINFIQRIKGKEGSKLERRELQKVPKTAEWSAVVVLKPGGGLFSKTLLSFCRCFWLLTNGGVSGLPWQLESKAGCC